MVESQSAAELQRPPPADALDHLCAAIAPGAVVVDVRRLGGDMSGGVHAVDLRRAGARKQTVVLKRLSSEFLARSPRAFDVERRALDMAKGGRAPVPRVLWADRAGTVFGAPALALSHLPGISLTRAMDSSAPDDVRWIRQVARALARIHGTPTVPGDRDLLGTLDAATVGVDLRKSLADGKRAARAALLPRGGEIAGVLTERWNAQPASPAVLVHGDFHPGNLLWQHNRVCGVIDWSDARMGAAEYDLAHFRWELALRSGAETAERFLEEYRLASRSAVPAMVLWDLLTIWRLAGHLGSWVWFYELEGQTVTIEALERQRTRWIERVLEGI